MNGLLDYQCVVHESGYEIVTGSQMMKYHVEGWGKIFKEKHIGEDISYFIRPIDRLSPTRRYNMMEHQGVFYEFIKLLPNIEEFADSAESKKILDSENSMLVDEDLKDSKNKIIEFANKYGLLTTTLTRGYLDSLSSWYSHVKEMDFAFYILELIKQSNIQELKNIIHMEGGNFKYFESDVTIDSEWASIIWQTSPQNELDAAYGFICEIVNVKLRDCVTTNIISNSRNTGVQMAMYPKDLISALWLQLAHSLSRNLEFKQCAACSTFFEVKSKKRRFERKYCSDKCGKRVYARKRREKEEAK